MRSRRRFSFARCLKDSSRSWPGITGLRRITNSAGQRFGRTLLQSTKAKSSLWRFFSNLLSPSLTDFEKYWNFKRLQELSGLSQTGISESAGLSKSHVTRIFSFDALPDAAKTALAEKPERLGSNAAQKLAALVEAGKADKVVEAVRRLVDDENFTQDKAVALAAEKPKAAAPSTTVVRSGRKKVCEVTTRNGVVGVRFFEAEAVDAERWGQRIADFINQTLNETNQE